ncbi:hypothetical protein Dda_0155 [Drechslerella dactyloides]|uniref:Uncharacterized protein n=1 Tax=Drechslerella dactyloides TaxID=74499 RepID=A0AAD6J7L6_DREDA|nr:hypothetical protein Dda_0155 [Drechslerella dactyloides]
MFMFSGSAFGLHEGFLGWTGPPARCDNVQHDPAPKAHDYCIPYKQRHIQPHFLAKAPAMSMRIPDADWAQPKTPFAS